MDTYLTEENGLFSFTIPKSGKYEIVQTSMSWNWDSSKDESIKGPSMGVTVTLELDLKKVS